MVPTSTAPNTDTPVLLTSSRLDTTRHSTTLTHTHTHTAHTAVGTTRTSSLTHDPELRPRSHRRVPSARAVVVERVTVRVAKAARAIQVVAAHQHAQPTHNTVKRRPPHNRPQQTCHTNLTTLPRTYECSPTHPCCGLPNCSCVPLCTPTASSTHHDPHQTTHTSRCQRGPCPHQLTVRTNCAHT